MATSKLEDLIGLGRGTLLRIFEKENPIIQEKTKSKIIRFLKEYDSGIIAEPLESYSKSHARHFKVDKTYDLLLEMNKKLMDQNAQLIELVKKTIEKKDSE